MPAASAPTTSRWSTGASRPIGRPARGCWSTCAGRAARGRRARRRSGARARADRRGDRAIRARSRTSSACRCSAPSRESTAAIRLRRSTDRNSAVVEAYLAVQTNLHFSTEHGVPRLAGDHQHAAARGQIDDRLSRSPNRSRAAAPKVVLVDADMRSPSHPSPRSASPTTGAQQLPGRRRRSRLLMHCAKPAGASGDHAGRPATAQRRRIARRHAPGLLIADAAEQFDHVIVDCPPVMGLADAPLVASQRRRRGLRG